MDIEGYFRSFNFKLHQFLQDAMIGYLDIEYLQGAIHFDVEEGLSDIPLTAYMDIPDIDGVSEEEICNYLNSAELKRAKQSLNSIKAKLKKLPGQIDFQNKKTYYEYVIGEYINWYEINGIDPIETTGSNTDADKPKKKTRPKDLKRDKNNQKLQKRYYELSMKKGLKKNKCLDILEKEFPYWSRSTIETYLKR